MTETQPTDEIARISNQLRAEGIDESRIRLFEHHARAGRWMMARKALSRPVCGAKLRHGRTGRCMSQPVPGRNRCKWHGGMTTGIKTPEGRARQIAGARAYVKTQPRGPGGRWLPKQT